MAALVDANEQAKNQLYEEIKNINRKRDEAAAKVKAFGEQHWLKRYHDQFVEFVSRLRWHWVGVVGLSIIVLLPLLSKGMSIGDFSIGRAQAHAWEALDSSFAEAFSLIAIAIVFFAGAQFRRKQEATQKYELATEKANWAQARLQAETRSKTIEQYSKARRDLAELKIQRPLRLFRPRQFSRRASTEDISFGTVIEAARKYAQGPALNMIEATSDDIGAQTAIINEIVSGTALWTDPLHLNDAARFLTLVFRLRTELFDAEQRAQWEKLTTALNKSRYAEASTVARQLAPALLLNADFGSEIDGAEPESR